MFLFSPSPAAGEQPRQGIIAQITPGESSLVTFVDDERVEFQVRGEKEKGAQSLGVHNQRRLLT